jgi:signal transduction histidine kinase
MKKTAIVISTLLTLALPAMAEDFATAKDAEALVAKLVKAVTADSAATYKEVNAKDPKWTHGDLYPVVIDTQGQAPNLAHGMNSKIVGKDNLDLEDMDGKKFVQEMIKSAKAKGKSWTDLKYTDPVTKKILPKSMYCELVPLKSGDVIACAGIYKR